MEIIRFRKNKIVIDEEGIIYTYGRFRTRKFSLKWSEIAEVGVFLDKGVGLRPTHMPTQFYGRYAWPPPIEVAPSNVYTIYVFFLTEKLTAKSRDALVQARQNKQNLIIPVFSTGISLSKSYIAAIDKAKSFVERIRPYTNLKVKFIEAK